MSLDYASATINAVTTTGPPGSPPVQPPIAYNKLTAASLEMWNGHIGTRQAEPSPAARMTPGGSYVGLPATPGRNNLGAAMVWCSSAAGAAAGAAGTVTGGVFVAGAGTAIANSLIPAGGGGWVTS